MISIKSIQFLQPARSQKRARQELQKQDFFQTLLTQLRQKFKPDEYQFLIDYIIPRRYESKDRKRQPLYRYKNFFSTHSKENTHSVTYSKGQIPKRIKPAISFQQFNTQSSQEEFQTSIRKTQTKQRKSKKLLMKKAYSHQQMTAITESQNKKKSSQILKLRETSFIDKQNTTLKIDHPLKLTKKSNKALGRNLFTQQKIKRSYIDSFMGEIAKPQIKQEDHIRKESFNFRQSLERKTYQPDNSFWEKEKELQNKYRHFTSIRFQTPQKKSKSGLQIYKRKF